MKRFLAALLVAAAGCGESIRPDEMPGEEAGDEGTELEIPREVYENFKTSELDTDKTRPIAKTIEWPKISSQEGDTYLGDALVIDRILREDADHTYGVRVRVKNTTKTVVQAEYLVRFVTCTGGTLGGWLGGDKQGDRWTPFVVEPVGVKEIGDFCRVMGAEGFRLAVRAKGGTGDGGPDDPEKKEERKLQREGRTQ